MSIERVGQGLNTINEILRRPTLDPDPARQDWALHREALATLVTTIEQEILAPLGEALTELGDDEEQRDKVRNLCADRVGDAAGLLLAAQQREPARRLLQGACAAASPGPVAELVAAGLVDPERFVLVTRAWWLIHQQRRDEAIAVARAASEDAPSAIANSVRQIVEAPRPISSAPALWGINGFGVRVYGERDPRPDGTYVTTRYVTALFVPVLPLDAFRVSKSEDGWYFLGKESLSAVTRWWRRLMAVALVVGVLGGLVHHYLTSPGHRLAVAIESAQQAEAEAGPEGRAAVVDQYEAILMEFPEASPTELRPVIEAFVRLSAADVASPLTVEHLAEVKRIAMRYRALPEVAHSATQAQPMVALLEQWAQELGTEGPEPILGAIELLGDARALATPSEADRLNTRRRELNRMLAAGLAAEWPLEAIRQYASMPEDPEAVAAAGALLERLSEEPSMSVWLELSPTIDRWEGGARHSAVASTRELVLEQRAAAQAAAIDPARLAALALTEPEALAAVVAAAPGDQELAVALADLKLAEGDAAGALAVLTAIGPPGRMVLEAQASLASAYATAGREAEADALLERVLTSRLPAFESAQRMYVEKADALSEQLLEKAQQGHLPPAIMRKLQNASEAQQQKIFGEWLEEQIEQDRELSRLRDEYTALAGVVGIAIQWGTIKLRRANAEEGEARQKLLDGAERAFLAIGREGSGVPSYHLGLGQVYYRMGKEQEGERELASLLDDDPLEVQLAVASTYRELGLVARAREVAEHVYETAEPPLTHAAAQLIAVMATDRDEVRTWLGRCDQSQASVRWRLLELEASDLVEKGDYAGADAKLAEVAAGWGEQSKHDSTAANNAALAVLSRYECTGEIARLREAVELLERSRSLAPDNALVVGNLGSSIELLASVELLELSLHPERLRLSHAEVQDLLIALLHGPEHARLRKAMSTSQSLRRALDMIQQEQVLAPKSASPYGRLLRWHSRRADERALAQLARTVESVKVDLTDETAARAAAIAGSMDATALEDLEHQLTNYEALEGAVQRHGHRPTHAALLWLKADALQGLAVLRKDEPSARRAVEAFAAAHAQWDGLDTTAHASALLHLAMLEATKDSATRDDMDALRRQLGPEGLMAWLLRDGGATLTALRARPELAEAIALRRGVDAARLDVFDWLLAQLGSDAELLTASTTILSRPEIRTYYDLGPKLTPGPEGIERVRDLIDVASPQ